MSTAEKLKLKPEILPLTGIRAIAAFAVVLYHMRGLLFQCNQRFMAWCDPVISYGYLGVDLFFILSGFIIYYNYAARLKLFRFPAICEFLWMRLARLWPVHVVVLAFFVLLLLAQRLAGMAPDDPSLYRWSDLFRHIFLIQGWAVPLNISWNVPAWSISCEWAAYLAFPLLMASGLFSSSAWRSVVVALIGLFGTALIFQKIDTIGGPNIGINYGLIRIAGEFMAGCALCHIFRTGMADRLPWAWIVPAACLLMLAGFFYILPSFSLVSYWCVPLLGLIVLGLAYHRCLVSRLCSMRFMLFGGYISYSMYMIHELTLIVMKRVNPSLGVFAPITDIVAIIAASVVLFYLVEEPCRKKMRALYPRHKQQPYPVI